MTTIKRIEELDTWQLANELARQVYAKSSYGRFSRDFGLKDQSLRSANSICANIAEGFERHGNQEFIQFLMIAKSSAGELRSHLYTAFDRGYITETELESLLHLCNRVSAAIYGFVQYLKKSNYRGQKYVR
jgi:four helix bundle protein